MFVLNVGIKFSGALSNVINVKQRWTWISDDICCLGWSKSDDTSMLIAWRS